MHARAPKAPYHRVKVNALYEFYLDYIKGAILDMSMRSHQVALRPYSCMMSWLYIQIHILINLWY